MASEIGVAQTKEIYLFGVVGLLITDLEKLEEHFGKSDQRE